MNRSRQRVKSWIREREASREAQIIGNFLTVRALRSHRISPFVSLGRLLGLAKNGEKAVMNNL